MSRPERPSRHRIGRIIGSALVLSSWLAVSAIGSAAPVLARTCGTITIEDGTVSPGTGHPDTSFTFSVRVSDTTGEAPQWVRVRVRQQWTNLGGSGDPAAGITYSGSRTLPEGSWGYLFRTRSASGQICDHTQVSPAKVVVKPEATPPPTPAPTATPNPTPKPTAKPTPTPTPVHNATPTPTPKPAATSKAGATKAPTPKPTARSGGGKTKPTGEETPRPTATRKPRVTSSPDDRPTATPEPSPSPTPTSTVVPIGGGVTGDGPGPGSSGGGLSIDLVGFVDSVPFPLGIWLVTSAVGVLIFLLLIRRSGADEGWTAGLALAGAGAGAGSTGGGSVQAGAAGPVAVSGAGGDGAAVAAAAAATRTFAQPAAKGVERAKVGYRKVRISSKPDAVRSVELGRLERGDEVEILDSYEGFLQVRTPDDIVGWILRHTIVGAPS